MVGWSITFRLLSHFGTDPLSQISSQSQFHNCIRFCHSSEWVRTSCESAGSTGRHLRTKQSNWPTSVHLHFATILHSDLVPGCSKYPSFSTPGLPLQCIGSNCQTGDQKSESLLRGLKKGVKTYQQPTGRFVWNGLQKQLPSQVDVSTDWNNVFLAPSREFQYSWSDSSNRLGRRARVLQTPSIPPPQLFTNRWMHLRTV